MANIASKSKIPSSSSFFNEKLERAPFYKIQTESQKSKIILRPTTDQLSKKQKEDSNPDGLHNADKKTQIVSEIPENDINSILPTLENTKKVSKISKSLDNIKSPLPSLPEDTTSRFISSKSSENNQSPKPAPFVSMESGLKSSESQEYNKLPEQSSSEDNKIIPESLEHIKYIPNLDNKSLETNLHDVLNKLCQYIQENKKGEKSSPKKEPSNPVPNITTKTPDTPIANSKKKWLL
ncbi:hypothetical protein HZS_7191, partial [Henneguya salminicola]